MLTATLLFSAIAALAIFTRFLTSKDVISDAIGRKILHVGAISVSAFSPYLVRDHGLLLWFAIGSLPTLYILVLRGYFWDSRQKRPSWGVFYFALVFAALLYFFADDAPKIFYPLFVLALADGFAAIVGEIFGRHTYQFGNAVKSLEGSVAFFVSSCFALGLFPLLFPSFSPPFHSASLFISISIFLTVIEALSINGRDNLWIPIATIYWMLLPADSIAFMPLLIVALIATLSFFAYHRLWLSSSGALAAFTLGFIILISSEPIWIVPALCFFLVGTGLSKFPGKLKQISGRNANQVFCNGAAPVAFLALYFLSGQEALLVAYTAGFAAAISDTSSSEIGSRFGKSTYQIIGLKKIEAGLSGGITVLGIFVGLGFAGLMALVEVCVSGRFSPWVFMIVLSAGFVGNLLDSIFGQLLQIKYFESHTHRWSDYPSVAESQVTRGYKYIDNDIVNLCSTGTASALGYVLYLLL